MKVRQESDSYEVTEALGSRLGIHLGAGDVVGLTGELGSGKTCFVRGLARGLGVREGIVTSPSFTMIAEYRGRLPLYHIDLYRLETGPVDPSALYEYLYGNGVSAIEWAERLPTAVLKEYIAVRMKYLSLERREIEITANSERLQLLLEQMWLEV